MARMLPFIKCSFLAVVDLKTPRSTYRALLDSGAQLVVVDEPNGQGGYLLRRLDTVCRLCAENPNYRWPNQYENWASPDIHMGTTGPEIAEQAGPELKTVYTPVSTGDTFAGIAAFLRSHRPDVAGVVVDVTGSVALGGTAGRRLIPGIGASRRSSFLQPNSYHRAVLVDDIDAIAVCRIVREDLCLTLDGSSGCCISALLADLAVGRGNGFSVCLAADGGTKYLDTLYSDDWAVTQGIHEDLTSAIKRFRYEGLSFAWEPTAA